jgi:hypothetical protein
MTCTPPQADPKKGTFAVQPGIDPAIIALVDCLLDAQSTRQTLKEVGGQYAAKSQVVEEAIRHGFIALDCSGQRCVLKLTSLRLIVGELGREQQRLDRCKAWRASW